MVSAGATQVDFPESTAYVRSRIELGVRLNLEGREPNGVVPEAEYETVRTHIIDALRSARTPEGEPVFETVRPREEYFHGPEAEHAVDIVTIPADFEHFISATLRDEQFGPPTEPWNHKLQGTFAASGAAINRRAASGMHTYSTSHRPCLRRLASRSTSRWTASHSPVSTPRVINRIHDSTRPTPSKPPMQPSKTDSLILATSSKPLFSVPVTSLSFLSRLSRPKHRLVFSGQLGTNR